MNRMTLVGTVAALALSLPVLAANPKAGKAEAAAPAKSADPKAFTNLKAAMTDAKLEAALLAAARAHATDEGWKEDFTKVKINTKWSPKRNELTGIILGRSLSAWVLAKWPDGHCTYQDFSFESEYDGKNYGDVTFGGVGDQTDSACP